MKRRRGLACCTPPIPLSIYNPRENAPYVFYRAGQYLDSQGQPMNNLQLNGAGMYGNLMVLNGLGETYGPSVYGDNPVIVDPVRPFGGLGETFGPAYLPNLSGFELPVVKSMTPTNAFLTGVAAGIVGLIAAKKFKLIR